MIDNSWSMAFRVFIWGFSSVYVILVILMYCVKSMSGLVQKLNKDEQLH